MSYLPPALAPVLQSLLHARYGSEQREECAGWRGVFEERAADGVLVATRDVEAGETVFLIDHLWCTTLLEARAQLTAHPFIRRNLQAVLGIDEESESDADDDDEEEEEEEKDEAAGGYGAPSEGASPNNSEDDDETSAMRARLLAFLGLDTHVAATTTEVDLDGIVEAPAERPEPAFLSYVLRALPALFPDVEALSLQSLGLCAGWAAEVKATVAALPRLRALWLNGNGVARALAADAEVQDRLEIYNRRLTGTYSGWALRYLAAGATGKEQGPTKLDLAGRGLTALKPEAFAALVPSLCWLDLSRNPTLHPGPAHSHLLPALRALPKLESLRVDVAASEGDDEEDGEEERLARALPSLRWINGRYITRAGGRVLLDDGDDGDAREQGGQQRQATRRRQEIVDKVLMGVWAQAEPMRLAGPTARHHAELHWCVLDLPGLALGHGSSMDGEGAGGSSGAEPPNIKNNVAVLHMRDRALGVTFSAAWPVRRLARGQPVTRDYLEGFPRPLPCDPGRLLAHLRGADGGGLPGNSSLAAAEAEAWENVEEGQQKQQEPPPPPAAEPVFPIDGAAARPLRVFTDMPVLRENLGLPHLFGFTDDVEDADIVWTAGVPSSSPSTSQQQQQQWRGTLPNLSAVDDKCGMARLLRRGGPPKWLPRTFCLPEELPALLAHWERRGKGTEEEGEEEELWILKPPHLARGWDIALASELPCVLRHMQASGRLSVSRYLPWPTRWADGHKYDLRFYCLLLSPTQVLIHEHFRVRRAAEPYSLQRRHRHDLRRHLTNTTLGLGPGGGGTSNDDTIIDEDEAEAGCPTETLHMDAFTAGFGRAHPQAPAWPAVRARVEGMLAECFARLAAAGADGGLSAGEPDPCGRALLGVDVLLGGEDLEPYLVELNASPNVIGIVRERPSFWDEVFAAAFLRSPGGVQGAADGVFHPLLLLSQPRGK